MYASIADLRAEGVSVAQASNARLRRLSREASAEIDRVTGCFFEPRKMRFRLNGRDVATLWLPAHPIALSELLLEGEPLSLDPSELVVVGAPVVPGEDGPRLTRRFGVFPRGLANVELSGRFGFTEFDGSPEGRTPLAIRRACVLMVLRWLPELAGPESEDARNRWRVIEERTRDQSFKLDKLTEVGPFTGDPEIDRILLRYRRPMAMGAV